MLKVLIDSFEIDFDGVIPLRILNPMFSDEMSHSFNCKTVNTARNKDIINQLHLPEVGYNQVQFPAQIITEGFSFIGAIYINSVMDEYIDFQFNSQNDFWNKASVSLRSTNIPFDVRYLPVQNSKMMEKFPPTGLYCGYMNGLDSNAAAIAGEETPPVPFQKLSTTFEGILNNFKVRIEQNDLKTHRDLDQLYMFNCNSNGKYAYPGISFAFVIFVVTIVDQKFIFDSRGAQWPLCTNDVYNPQSIKLANANLTLRWDGQYGLYNQFYKEWIDLLVNRYREETRFINWPGWMLNSFARWKKYRVNHMNYLVKSIDLEITPAGTRLKDTVLVPV